jgi:leucyl/phenylalanyl-tRNA--protein transferase
MNTDSHIPHNIIPPQVLLMAYQEGYFPMAESRDGPIYWHFADPRAIIPLNKVKPHKSVRQTIRRENLTFKRDADFETVIRKCAARNETWISDDIIDSYINLHHSGYAHSIETYKDGKLVGGLYGVAIGGAFFGESMFSEISNASKAAFFYLCYHLNKHKFALLDSQYINEHTKLLGAIEIPGSYYLNVLKRAIRIPVTF